MGGSDLLLAAARQHARCGLDRLTASDHAYKGALYRAVVRMARAPGAVPATPAGQQALVAALAEVSASSLKAVLAIARPEARPLLCEALGWPEAKRLAVLIGEGAIKAYGPAGESVRNCSDPTNGVLDVAEARAALDEAGEPLARRLFRLFRAARNGARNQIMLLESVAGWNRDEIEKRLARRHQLSVKAYGLLPLERGQDEALERALWLRQFGQESQRYGPLRRAREEAAVRVALANLAQVSGAGDAAWLEQQMEARLATEVAPPGHLWQVGAYEVELMLADGRPELAVRRDGRRLKGAAARAAFSAICRRGR